MYLVTDELTGTYSQENKDQNKNRGSTYKKYFLFVYKSTNIKKTIDYDSSFLPV